MTIVELTQKDAELFVQFMKHRMLFKALIDSDIHLIQSGSAVLYFDESGKIGKIKIERVVFKT